MAQALKRKQKWMLLRTLRFTTLCVVSRNNPVLLDDKPTVFPNTSVVRAKRRVTKNSVN